MGQVLSHSELSSFAETGRTEHFPEGVGPDGEPVRWDEYAVVACRGCGRTAYSRVDRFMDERGRPEEWPCDPSPGEGPNEALPPGCDPGEAAVFSVMAS